MEQDIVIHAWSDIACPWCWIGKQRLAKGIALSGQNVAVEFHSYQLSPDAPTAPAGSFAEHLSHAKALDLVQADELVDDITDLAAAEGLELNADEVQEVNTFLAHQLVYAAKATGQTPEEAADLGTRMFERLYRAHFTEGRNIASLDVLLDIAASFDLNTDRVTAALESGDFADAVRQDFRDAAAIGVEGVPFYVVGGKLAFSGAQPAEKIAETINRAVAELAEEAAEEADDATLAEGVAH